MIRSILTLAASLLISCHSPAGAEIPQDSADTSQHRLALEPAAGAHVLAAIRVAAPHEPPGASVGLCCDIPSGLCFAAPSGACVSVTSESIACPVDRVRELPSVAAVVCAH